MNHGLTSLPDASLIGPAALTQFPKGGNGQKSPQKRGGKKVCWAVALDASES